MALASFCYFRTLSRNGFVLPGTLMEFLKLFHDLRERLKETDLALYLSKVLENVLEK